MLMYVYHGNKRGRYGERTPIVVESNLDWAIPHWTERKRHNKDINWEIR
jgi:hypothetical protein